MTFGNSSSPSGSAGTTTRGATVDTASRPLPADFDPVRKTEDICDAMNTIAPFLAHYARGGGVNTSAVDRPVRQSLTALLQIARAAGVDLRATWDDYWTGAGMT